MPPFRRAWQIWSVLLLQFASFMFRSSRSALHHQFSLKLMNLANMTKYLAILLVIQQKMMSSYNIQTTIKNSYSNSRYYEDKQFCSCGSLNKWFRIYISFHYSATSSNLKAWLIEFLFYIAGKRWREVRQPCRKYHQNTGKCTCRGEQYEDGYWQFSSGQLVCRCWCFHYLRKPLWANWLTGDT